MTPESPAVETLAEIRNIVLRYAEPITASGRASLNETVAALAAHTRQTVDAVLGEARRLSPVHPLEATWKPGERVEYMIQYGPYGTVDTRPGTVARIERTYGYHEHLVVAFDDGEERRINPDVMRHVRARGGEDRG